MDHNLAYSCIGYGSVRALCESRRVASSSGRRSALPAGYILEKPDPVQFCIDALGTIHPDWVEGIDEETRLAIHARLREEARKAQDKRN
jgi:hypothetical protein